jgi:hypothetical protein
MRNDLAADFKSSFTTPFSLPTQWENAPFQVPQGAIAWVKFNVLPGQEELASIGPKNLYRFGGVMKIVIFVPLVQGVGYGLTAADAIAKRYRDIGGAIAGVVFMGAHVNEPLPDDAMPDWWKIVVDCAFRADLYA